MKYVLIYFDNGIHLKYPKQRKGKAHDIELTWKPEMKKPKKV